MLSLNEVVLANPVQVDTDSEPVRAVNVALGGIVIYDHASLDATMYVHVIRLQWQNLSAAEFAAIKGAWEAASDDYVLLHMDGLHLIGNAAVDDDEMFVMVQEDSELSQTEKQGWTAAGEGPVIYDAAMSLVSEPQVDN